MNDRSHISVILDRTGSMESIRVDVVGGFNSFLSQQQAAPHPATFTLVQFDSQDPYEVLHAFKPISEIRPLTLEQYVPRASTPLYDAMGRGILDLEAKLAAMPEAYRPGKIIFVVVTDGQENASREFNRARVQAMIETRKAQGWDFVFLSADQSAFHDVREMGVDADSSLMFHKSKRGNDAAWLAASSKISERRSGRAEKVVFDSKDRKSSE